MKKYALYLTLVLITLIGAYSCYDLKNIKTVYGTHIKNYNYTPHITVSGEFQSIEDSQIKMAYPVFIKDVFVTENSYVNKGQALFSIDKEKISHMLTENSELINYLSSNYKNLLNLVSSDLNLSYIAELPEVVYAPRSGIVAQINIDKGDIALPDQELLSINNSDENIAKFTLSQLDYGKIEIGNEVIIMPVAFENRQYKGTISENNAVIKKQSSLTGSKVVVDVFAQINNPDALISDGLQINGVIQTGEQEIISTIEYDFINQDINGQYVYILEKGKARKIYIETGIEFNGYTQILTDLATDTIIIKDNVEEGDRVIVINNE